MSRPVAILALVTLVVAAAGSACTQTKMPNAVLPPPQQPFQGKITERAKDSKPWFPTPPTAPASAPNILLILLDDVGFGAGGASSL